MYYLSAATEANITANAMIWGAVIGGGFALLGSVVPQIIKVVFSWKERKALNLSKAEEHLVDRRMAVYEQIEEIISELAIALEFENSPPNLTIMDCEIRVEQLGVQPLDKKFICSCKIYEDIDKCRAFEEKVLSLISLNYSLLDSDTRTVLTMLHSANQSAIDIYNNLSFPNAFGTWENFKKYIPFIAAYDV